MKLHSEHDEASNMVKASRLLKVEEPQHCLAHSLYLLLSEDSFKKVQGVQGILTKARNLISALTYQSYAISQDSLFKADNAIFEKMLTLNEIQKLNDYNDQFPLETDETDNNEQDKSIHDEAPTHNYKNS